MSIEWGDFFDGLVINEDSSWDNVKKALKTRSHEVMDRWLRGDRKALANTVKAALKDKQLTEKEIVGILALVALVWKDEITELGSGLVTELIELLGDGELTSDEIALLAGNWTATYLTKDDTLRQMIRTAAAGNLDKEVVLDALLDWAEKRSGNPTLKEQIQRVLKSAKPVAMRSLVLLAASYLIAQRKLKKAGPTHESMASALVESLNQLGTSTLAEAFEGLAQQDYAKVARLVLDELGIDDYELIAQALLRILLKEEPKAAIQDFLTGALKRELGAGINDDQAKALARAFINVVTGKTRLIPELAERELYFKKYKIVSEQYDIWIKVRRILYCAKLAVAGGAVVPDDPQARPHVFAAVSITPDTVIASLAPKADWQLLIDCIYLFTRQSFGNHPKGGKYLDRNETPVQMDVLKKGWTADFLLEDIYQALHFT